MSVIEQIKHLIARCSPAQRREIFRQLREEFPIHPLEMQLNTEAEIILEAIQRSGGLTLRMMRGVIAEAAFEVDVRHGSTAGPMSRLQATLRTTFFWTMDRDLFGCK